MVYTIIKCINTQQQGNHAIARHVEEGTCLAQENSYKLDCDPVLGVGTVTVITFAMESNSTGVSQRLLSTNLRSALQLAIALKRARNTSSTMCWLPSCLHLSYKEFIVSLLRLHIFWLILWYCLNCRSGVPISYVNINVTSMVSSSARSAISPDTLVFSNVIFTNTSSALVFLDTVINDPGAILSASTASSVQVTHPWQMFCSPDYLNIQRKYDSVNYCARLESACCNN